MGTEKLTLDWILSNCRHRFSTREATLLLECVEQNAYTKREAMIIVKGRNNQKINVFRGRPTDNFPNGRLYSPELLVRTISEKGNLFPIPAARARIKSARENPEMEDELFRPRNAQRSKKGRKIKKSEIYERTDSVLKEERLMRDVHNGRISVNEWLYG